MKVSTAIFRFSPTPVDSLAYKEVVGIACGAHHTAARVIRAWVHDQEAKSCMACKVRFTTVKRKVRSLSYVIFHLHNS